MPTGVSGLSASGWRRLGRDSDTGGPKVTSRGASLRGVAGVVWSPVHESNMQHPNYKNGALPIELTGQMG